MCKTLLPRQVSVSAFEQRKSRIVHIVTMAASETTVIQVTNIAPSTTLEQMTTLFEFVGSVREVRMYPKDDSSQQTSKVCFIRFADTKNVDVAQHLTNTVFIDRALIVTPFTDGKIPDETTAMNLANSGLSGGSNSGVVSQVVTTGQSQVITTIDPRLTALGLPQYPPLPANMDPAKIEEIRRTVYIGNLDSSISAEQLLKFFNQIGEVKYVRMAGDESQPTRFAFVEFTEQSSVANALQYNGVVLGGRPLKINHSNNAIVKPQTRSTEAAQKEIDEAMKRVREAQSLISAAIDPGYLKILDLPDSKTRSRSRSRSRSRLRDRSRSRSRRRSRSITRRSPSREVRSWERPRDRRRSPRRSRSRERRTRSRSRERRHRRRSYSRERDLRRRRSRSRDRERSSRRRRSRSRSRSRTKRVEEREKERDRSRIKEEHIVKPPERSESEELKVEGPALPPDTVDTDLTKEKIKTEEPLSVVDDSYAKERSIEGPSTPPPNPTHCVTPQNVLSPPTVRARSKSKSIERHTARKSPSPVRRRRSRSRTRRSRSRSYSRSDRHKRKRDRSRSRDRYREKRRKRRNRDDSGERIKESKVVRDYDEEEKGYDSDEEDIKKRNLKCSPREKSSPARKND
ncbi:splicing regulatory glutamine/lysine-rich protein 1-like isoform X3 [Leptotrombidium deliense]|uniref:Splicing regulatory glutamine/lysine-rich protein 1-like isoform X3 n=1 Tax=Leptotrombidium deliense TaxID=299467 RepID=A0A443SPB4_9ACAR|nr:splicing regulatory glutamine/lysine-rich protein 1-like isoform X3 [Leptotrombidium deliense]